MKKSNGIIYLVVYTFVAVFIITASIGALDYFNRNVFGSIIENLAGADSEQELVPHTTWTEKEIDGVDWYNFYAWFGDYYWNDGVNTYFSQGSDQYVIDVENLVVLPMKWNGLSSFSGDNIWTDGYDYYYSYGNEQYILDVVTHTWSPVEWVGLSSFNGNDVWKNGVNCYCSTGNSHYLLDIEARTWSRVSYDKDVSFHGSSVWTDGSNYYCMDSWTGSWYALDIKTFTVTEFFMNNLPSLDNAYIWKFNGNCYYSRGAVQCVWNSKTQSWEFMTWKGFTNFNGNSVWFDVNGKCYLLWTDYWNIRLFVLTADY